MGKTLPVAGVFALVAGATMMACSGDSATQPPAEQDPTRLVDHELPTQCSGDLASECLEQAADAVSFDRHALLGVEQVAVQDGTVMLQLKEGVTLPDKIKPGTVLFRTPKLGRPGFLRRVDAMDQDGRQVAIHTSPADLKDAFPQGRIRRKISMTPEMLQQAFEAQPRSSGTGSTSQPLTIGFDDCSGEIFNSSFQGVDINVSLEECSVIFTPDIELYIHWGGLIPDQITAIASGDFDALAKAVATVSAATAHSKEVRLLTIAVPIPAIASTIEMTINAGYHIEANAEVSVTSGFEADASLDVGFLWEAGNAVEPVWDPQSSYTPIPTVFTMEGSADGEVYLRPEIALKFLGSAGPTLDLKAYLSLHAYSRKFAEEETSPGVFVTDHQVCYELVVGLQPNLGVEVSILGIDLINESFKLATLEEDLASDCYHYNTTRNISGCPAPTECVVSEDCGSSEDTCFLYVCNNQCQCNELVATFCCQTNADCDDDDICTVDVCHITGGTCSNTPIYGCCRNDAECDDGNVSTSDTCNANNKCEHVINVTQTTCNTILCCDSNADCNDGNPNTKNVCTTDKVCTFPPLVEGGKLP